VLGRDGSLAPLDCVRISHISAAGFSKVMVNG
jgi:hypothetical protein